MAKKRNNRSLWIMLIVIAILGTIILFLPSCVSDNKGSDEYLVVNVGDEAPDFTVEMFDTPQITLSGLKGKVVLVNFWASWCPNCIESMKRVQTDIIDRFEDRNFMFLPISRGEVKGDVATYREVNGYTFPMGLDVSSSIYNKYATKYIPRNFLIDEDGVIIMTTLGSDEHNKLIEKIESITQ